MIKVKRVYEDKEPDDGILLLVDRLWPRGLRSTEADIDEWIKDIAPSNELRKWFAHDPGKWIEFKQRYAEELSAPDKSKLLERIARMAAKGNVTLLYAARDTEHNNARVLEEVINKLVKSKKM